MRPRELTDAASGSSRIHAQLLLLLALSCLAVAALPGDARPEHRVLRAARALAGAGRDEREPDARKPTVAAAFAAESYRPNTVAKLVLFDTAPRLTVQLYRVGDAHGPLRARDVMRGTPVGESRRLGAVRRGQIVRVPLYDAPSGLYFVKLLARRGRVGYAPFVLAPARLGVHRVAVVLPTETWQAYNFRDDDGDGSPDTWYAGPPHTTARLYRPFKDGGVPPHYRYYDEPFLRWLAHNHIGVDVISDAELKAAGGEALARAYRVLVFSGHHEYVTTHEYDAVTRYRDLGGSLLFLSANNFYAKIAIHHGVMTRVGWWRLLGRPEAALIGVELYHSDLGEHRGRWIVRPSRAGRWIFRGTGLRVGDAFANGGIEADRAAAGSPPNLQVLAEIVNLYGDGRNAQMTYYQTRNGARVFAAGAFTLAGSVWVKPVGRIIENLLAASLKP